MSFFRTHRGGGRGTVVATAALVGSLLTAAPGASAQQVFRSTQSANLPTAETLDAGWWLFEISHRFFPAVADGSGDLWGFDGPVFNRLGLAAAVTDRVMIGVQRSNRDDNLELNARARLWSSESEDRAFAIGVMGGVARNTEEPALADENEAQAYGQAMLNARFGSVALGLVPTVLSNPSIEDPTSETIFVLGGHGAIELNRSFSLFAEWVKAARRPGQEFDSGSFGMEIATRGHVFKVLLTNQIRANPTQYLAGTPIEFEPGEWRVGFNIQRRLRF